MKLYDNLRAVLFPSGYKSGQIYPQKPLIWNNPAYWYAPRVASNYCSAPYNAAITLRNNLDIKCFIKATQTSIEQIIFGTGSGSIKFSFRISSSNTLRLLCSIDGTTALIYDSTVVLPNPSALQWVRVTRNSTTGILLFYTSTDGISWTQLGAQVSAAIGALFNITSIYEIGSAGGGTTSALFNGFVYRVLVSETIDGVAVLDFNPNHFNWNSNMLQNGQTFTSRTTGETWTINSTGESYIQPYLETIPFTRASSGSRQLPSGIIENLAANMPRLDSPLNGCPGILMEPQRTNLVQYSTDFLVTGWISVASAVRELSTEVSPIQGQSVCKVTTTTGSYSGLYRTISGTSNNYTITTYVKKGTLNFVGLIDVNGLAPVAWFNIGNGTLGTVNAGYIGTIEPMINGFYKITLTRTGAAQVASYFQIFFTNTNGSVNGAVGETYIAYACTELGSFSSSAIITTNATATRPADAIQSASYQMLGLGGRGTIVIDYTLLGLSSTASGTPAFTLADNSNTVANRMYLLGEFAGGMRVWDYINSVYWYNATQTVGNRYKVLIKWDGSYGCCYVNGVKVFEQFNLNPIYFNYIKGLSLASNSIRLNGFHTDNIAVSHSDCIKLTTL